MLNLYSVCYLKSFLSDLKLWLLYFRFQVIKRSCYFFSYFFFSLFFSPANTTQCHKIRRSDCIPSAEYSPGTVHRQGSKLVIVQLPVFLCLSVSYYVFRTLFQILCGHALHFKKQSKKISV